MTTHHAKVSAVAAQISARRVAAQTAARGSGRLRSRSRSVDGHVTLDKREVSHFVPNPNAPRNGGAKVSIRDLGEVLHIDAEKRVAWVEPGVSFKELVTKTLRHGLVPATVPELETITVGGAISGCSVESMSHRYGGLHDSALRYEIVTGTGEIVTCSPEEDPLLFEMIHGSYGTLGVLTKVELSLVPAKPFVHMEYRRFSAWDAFHAEMRARIAARDFDFIDGIIHGRDTFVLSLGRFVESVPRTSDYRHTEIFYKSTRNKTEDDLTAPDYFFRYDTECHWLTRTVPGLESRAMRRLFGRWLLGSTNILTWSKRLRPVLKLDRNPDIIVDVFIPDEHAAEFYAWCEATFDYYPLWIVPYRPKDEKPYAWIAEKQAEKSSARMYVDFAIYGMRNKRSGADAMRLLEDKTFELGGIKTLISHNRYDRERFWSIYNEPRYRAVKARVDPDNLFRDLYEKMCFEVARP
jgi:FAD/FMN-containing dehydrogenase